MIVGVTTTPHGTVGGGLGRAQTVAVADVRDGEVTSWTEVPVGWGDLHGIGPEGTHHARIVRFVREHGLERVVTSGLGEGMRTTMGKLGVVVRTDLTGTPARPPSPPPRPTPRPRPSAPARSAHGPAWLHGRMPAVRFVDVFSESTCRGNALAVFHDADDLTDEQMAAHRPVDQPVRDDLPVRPDRPGRRLPGADLDHRR